jgi:hypothetical protein
MVTIDLDGLTIVNVNASGTLNAFANGSSSCMPAAQASRGLIYQPRGARMPALARPMQGAILSDAWEEVETAKSALASVPQCCQPKPRCVCASMRSPKSAWLPFRPEQARPPSCKAGNTKVHCEPAQSSNSVIAVCSWEQGSFSYVVLSCISLRFQSGAFQAMNPLGTALNITAKGVVLNGVAFYGCGDTAVLLNSQSVSILVCLGTVNRDSCGTDNSCSQSHCCTCILTPLRPGECFCSVAEQYI